MSAPQMSEAQWQLAETLAKDLAYRRVSHNLVRQATSYTTALRDTPELDTPERATRRLANWLERLNRLGATFASGRTDTTEAERKNLKEAIAPLVARFPLENWGLILAWTARLMLYHAAENAPARPAGPRNPSFNSRR
jgi:hypothetical protein